MTLKVFAAGLLQQSNASNATYLFQPDKLNKEYDLGDKTIQCGRRADAFKLWLAWKVTLHQDTVDDCRPHLLLLKALSQLLR